MPETKTEGGSHKKKKAKSKTQAVTKQQRCRQSRRELERETIRVNRGAAKSEGGEAAGLNTQGRQSARAIGATEEEERNKQMREARVDHHIRTNSFLKCGKY